MNDFEPLSINIIPWLGVYLLLGANLVFRASTPRGSGLATTKNINHHAKKIPKPHCHPMVTLEIAGPFFSSRGSFFVTFCFKITSQGVIYHAELKEF